MAKTRISSKTGTIITCCFVFMVMLLLMNIQNANAANGFYVSGTKLYDANGKQFIMRGVSYPHTWYKDQYKTALKAIAGKGFNTVRIVLSNGKQYNKDSAGSVKAVVDLCKQYKLIAVLEVHDATGSDDVSALNNAVSYWIEIKSVLQGNEKYVIVNIANEWAGAWKSEPWKNGYVTAIKNLRNAGISNTLMVDCAGWGQYPQSVLDYGQTVLAADSKKNTVFSIHMYEYAGGNASTVKSNIDNVLNKSLCLIIGEFGCRHTNGEVDEDTIMSYSKTKSVGWCAWSWTGNGSSYTYLNLSNDFAGTSLTSYGKRIISGTNGISQTSKRCSVFGS